MKKLSFVCLTALLVLPALAQTTTANAKLEVTVHPGIELFTIVQILAGKYPMPNTSAYTEAVKTHFLPYASHPAVQHVQKMGEVYTDVAELGYCLDNFPNVRIHYPDKLHWYDRYGKDTVQTYMRLCQQFFVDTHFWDFYQQHQTDYAAWAKPVRDAFAEQGYIEKLGALYRQPNTDAQWVICLDPLNSWGAHAIMTKTLNPRYANQVVYNVGYFNRNSKATDVPTFQLDNEAMNLVWHEGSHIITNGLQTRNKAAIDKLTYLFNATDEGMKRNNVETWAHCFDENLVRGVVIALFRQHNTPKEARKQAARELVGDFLYAGDIADVIATRYIGNPAYRTFEQFFPEILAHLARTYPAPVAAAPTTR